MRQELHHIEIKPAGCPAIPLANDPCSLEYLVVGPLPATGLDSFSLESFGMKALDPFLGLEFACNNQLDVCAWFALPEDYLISSVAFTFQIVGELCQSSFRPPTEEGNAAKKLYLSIVRVLNVLELCVIESFINHGEGTILQTADGGRPRFLVDQCEVTEMVPLTQDGFFFH
jgi:hypothetical protein